MLFVSVYILASSVYIPTLRLTPAGFQVAAEPVRVVDVGDADEVSQAILDAIALGNPRLGYQPSRSDPFILLGYTGVKTVKEFDKKARLIEIRFHENKWMIAPHTRRPDRGTEARYDEAVWLDDTASPEEVASATLSIMKDIRN